MLVESCVGVDAQLLLVLPISECWGCGCECLDEEGVLLSAFFLQAVGATDKVYVLGFISLGYVEIAHEEWLD